MNSYYPSELNSTTMVAGAAAEDEKKKETIRHSEFYTTLLKMVGAPLPPSGEAIDLTETTMRKGAKKKSSPPPESVRSSPSRDEPGEDEEEGGKSEKELEALLFDVLHRRLPFKSELLPQPTSSSSPSSSPPSVLRLVPRPPPSSAHVDPTASPTRAERPRLIVKERPGASKVVPQYDSITHHQQRKGEKEVMDLLLVLDDFVDQLSQSAVCPSPSSHPPQIPSDSRRQAPSTETTDLMNTISPQQERDDEDCVEGEEHSTHFLGLGVPGGGHHHDSHSMDLGQEGGSGAYLCDRSSSHTVPLQGFNSNSINTNPNNTTNNPNGRRFYYDDDEEEDEMMDNDPYMNVALIRSSGPTPSNLNHHPPHSNSHGNRSNSEPHGNNANGGFNNSGVYSSHAGGGLGNSLVLEQHRSQSVSNYYHSGQPPALMSPPMQGETRPRNSSPYASDEYDGFTETIPGMGNGLVFPTGAWQRIPFVLHTLGSYLYDNFFSLQKVQAASPSPQEDPSASSTTSAGANGKKRITPPPITPSSGVAALHRIVFHFIQSRLVDYVARGAGGEDLRSVQARILAPCWLYLLATSGVLELSLALQAEDQSTTTRRKKEDPPFSPLPALDLLLSTADATARLYAECHRDTLDFLLRSSDPVFVSEKPSISLGRDPTPDPTVNTPNTRSSSVRFSDEAVSRPSRYTNPHSSGGTEPLQSLCAFPPLDSVILEDTEDAGGSEEDKTTTEVPSPTLGHSTPTSRNQPSSVPPTNHPVSSVHTWSSYMPLDRSERDGTSLSGFDHSSNLHSKQNNSARGRGLGFGQMSSDFYTSQALVSFMDNIKDQMAREHAPHPVTGDSISVVMVTPTRSEQEDSTAAADVSGLPYEPRLSSEVPPITAQPVGLSNVGQIERELREAGPALQFAMKLGTLYATLDIDALMPLLPKHTDTTSMEDSIVYEATELNERMDARKQQTNSPSSESRKEKGCGQVVSRYPELEAQRGELKKQLEEFVKLSMLEQLSPSSFRDRDASAETTFTLTLIILSHFIELSRRTFSVWTEIRLQSRFYTIANIRDSIKESFATAATAALKRQRVHTIQWIYKVFPFLSDTLCNPSMAADPRRELLLSKQETFPTEWLAGFLPVADTAKHLLQSGHYAPKALELATWHLAALASYFTTARRMTLEWVDGFYERPNRLNEVLLLSYQREKVQGKLPSKRSGTGGSQVLRAAEASTVETLPSDRNAEQESEAIQKAYQEEKQSTASSRARLTEYMQSQIITPLERILPCVLSFLEVLATLFLSGELPSTVFEDLQPDDNDPDTMHSQQEDLEENLHHSVSPEMSRTRHVDVLYEKEQGYYLEHCVHYLLEVLDVLLEASEAIPAPYKPLSLCALCISLSSSSPKRNSEADWLTAANEGSSFTKSPPHPPLRTSRPHPKPEETGPHWESTVGRIQTFIDVYCHQILNKVINVYFTHNHERENVGLLLGYLEGNQQRLTEWSVRYDSLKLTPFRDSLETMWWPNQSFNLRLHIARIVQHAQWVATLFINREQQNSIVYLDTQERQCESRQSRYEHRISERLYTPLLTPFLDASKGSGAVLLSSVCLRPKIVYPNTIATPDERKNREVWSPRLRPLAITARYLWFRVRVLRVIALSAIPVDADLRGRFRTSVKRYARRLQDRRASEYYSDLGSLFSVQFSLLNSNSARTYVRLIFLRIVQAFNSDRSPISCDTIISLLTSIGTEGGGGVEHEKDEFLLELKKLNAENQFLWLEYLYELLRTLRLLCWHHESAHETGEKLSIPSVLARFFDKISYVGGDDTSTVSAANAHGMGSRGLYEETNSDDDEDHVLIPVESGEAAGMDPLLSTAAPADFVDFEDLGSDSSREETEEEAGSYRAFEEDVPLSPVDSFIDLGKTVAPYSTAIKRKERTKEEDNDNDNDPEPAEEPAASPVLVPKLSLGTLGPPLYFASTGDTSAAQEAVLFDKPHHPPAVLPTAESSPCASPKFEMDSPSSPATLVPKLALGFLSPPLYYTSTGDTGAAQETQSTLPQKEGPIDGPLESPKPISTVVSSQHSVAAESSYSPVQSPDFTPPVSGKPSVNIPKLSLGALGPPLYYTSTGDTGAMDENMPSPVPVVKLEPLVETVEEPPRELEEQAAEEDDEEEGEEEEEGEKFGEGKEEGNPTQEGVAAAPKKAAFIRIYTPRVIQPVKSVHAGPAASAKAEARIEKRRLAESKGIPPLFGMKSASPLRDMRSRSLPPPVNQSKSPSAALFAPLQRSVSAELVLCVASLLLERHSGSIQYPFTLSFLTERRQPHNFRIQPRLMDPSRQRDPLGNRVRHSSASAGVSRLGPTAYHVLKSLQDFVHFPGNAAVRGLLKHWLYNEFGGKMHDILTQQTELAMEREEAASMEGTCSFTFTESSLAEFAMERTVPTFSLGYFVLLRLLIPRKGFMRHFEITRRVGSGGYGSVLGVTYTSSSVIKVNSFVFTEHRLLSLWKNELTIKAIPLHLQGSESGSLPMVHSEVLALLRMRHHPRVMTLLTFGCTSSEYLLVSPLYKGGSFSDWRLQRYPPGCVALMRKKDAPKAADGGITLSDTTSTNRKDSTSSSSSSLLGAIGETFLQVLEAVCAAHQLDIRHGDLKAANVFIERFTNGEDGVQFPSAVRLGDFGSCDTCGEEDVWALYQDVEGGESRFLSGRWGSSKGTEAVLPPEVMVPKHRYNLLRTMIEKETERLFPATAVPPTSISATAASNSNTTTANTTTFRRSSAARDILGSSHPSEVNSESVFSAVKSPMRQMELSVDVWACGCLLYEMLTGRMLFGEARLGRLISIAGSYRDATTTAATTTNHPTEDLKEASRTLDSPCSPTRASLSPMITALDDWERRDLQRAVGEPVVRFLASLLGLDPLRRPTSSEALYAWREILLNDIKS